MSKTTLFEPPLSHRQDPPTSFEAADRMVKSGRLNRQEQEVWEALKKAMVNMSSCLSTDHCNFTAKQLSGWSGIDYFIVQRRFSGLRNKGRIERTGEKRNGCMVWKIIERR